MQLLHKVLLQDVLDDGAWPSHDLEERDKEKRDQN